LVVGLGLDGETDESGGNRSMMEKRNIPVAAPMLVGNEKSYVMDCLDSTWISSTGKYVERFESAFADFCEARHAISCCNGTVALHLALVALGLKPGDEVIVPTLTFVATANVVTYCGATPIFVDVDPATWTMDPSLIEQKITSRTRGIIVVHLYGQPTDLDPVLDLASRHSLFVVEDAAEAHGAEYKGKKVGSLTAVGAFSFYGNKALTTGEGGMLTTNDERLAAKRDHAVHRRGARKAVHDRVLADEAGFPREHQALREPRHRMAHVDHQAASHAHARMKAAATTAAPYPMSCNG